MQQEQPVLITCYNSQPIPLYITLTYRHHVIILTIYIIMICILFFYIFILNNYNKWINYT